MIFRLRILRDDGRWVGDDVHRLEEGICCMMGFEKDLVQMSHLLEFVADMTYSRTQNPCHDPVGWSITLVK